MNGIYGRPLPPCGAMRNIAGFENSILSADFYLQVVELWTKRKFRCDCGNSKFGESSCKLCPIKDDENVDNSYNHNFKGLYCTCGRPYPNPQAEGQVEMIQCCICEDWFHENHLGLDSTDEVVVKLHFLEQQELMPEDDI